MIIQFQVSQYNLLVFKKQSSIRIVKLVGLRICLVVVAGTLSVVN